MPAASPTVARFEPEPSRFKLGQRPCLDGLRGVATLIVTFSHFGLIRGSVVGLEILFVLSGFLITALLVDEWERRRSISIPAFYLRRARRIVPPLFAMMAVVSAISIALGTRTPREMLGDCLASGLFLTDGFAGGLAGRTMFGQTWSLSLEFQFYLVWPVVFLLLMSRGGGPKRVIGFLVVGIIVESIARTVMFAARPSESTARWNHLVWLYLYPQWHSDTLMVGCLAGALVAWGRLPKTAAFGARLRNAGFCSLALLAYGVVGIHHGLPAYYCGLETLLGVAAAAVLVWLMRQPPTWLLNTLGGPLLAGVGRVSYGLFLFHMPIVLWMEPKTPGGIAVGLLLSFAAAFGSYFAVERYFLKRRASNADVVTAKEMRRAA